MMIRKEKEPILPHPLLWSAQKTESRNILTFPGDNYINGWFVAMGSPKDRENGDGVAAAGILVFGRMAPGFFKE